MRRRPELAQFTPGGQVAMPMPGVPAQLALDGTPMEPAAPPPWQSLVDIIEARSTSPDQLELPAAGELPGVKRQPKPKRKSRRTIKRRQRRAVVVRAKKRIEERSEAKGATRRDRMERAVTLIASGAKAGEDRVRIIAEELPRNARAAVLKAAQGRRRDGTPRVSLKHPRARKTVALGAALFQAARASSARPGWRMVTFCIARLAGLLDCHRNTLAGKTHRRAGQWELGDNGYLRALQATGLFAVHQPRRIGDGRAPEGIPVTERGPDESPTKPGYAFAQFWFPPLMLTHRSADELEAEERVKAQARERVRAGAGADELRAFIAGPAPPPD